jgi:hypothetical protein
MRRLLFSLVVAAISASALGSTWSSHFKQAACSATSATCAVSSISPVVGAGNLLIIAVWLAQADDAITISSISGDACTLVISAGIAGASVEGGLRTAYCLSAAGAESSVTITVSSAPANAWRAEVDYASSTAPPYFLDSSGSADQTTVVSPQPGIAFAEKGANDVMFQWIRLGGGTVSSINGAYTVQLTSGVVSSAVALNTVTGTAPSWTLSSGQKSAVAGLAFGDASGGGAIRAGPTSVSGPATIH